MKRKSYLLLSFILMLCLAYLFASTAVMAADYQFRVAYTDPPRLSVGDEELIHVTPAAVYAFEDNINRLTGGNFEVIFEHSASLGTQIETIDQTQAGIIEATTPAIPALEGYYPDIQILNIPFLFDNPVIAWEVLDSDFIRNMFDEMAEETGLRIIAIADNGGYRNFSNNVREIRAPADMEGLTFRIMESPAQSRIVESLGASSEPIAFDELYTALQTGVVDGQENSPATVVSGSLQEVQDYYTIDQHTLSLFALVISEDWFQSLPEDVQNKVKVAGRAAETAARGAAYSNNQVVMDYLSQEMEITHLTSEERQAFRDATEEPVLNWMYDNDEIDNDKVDQLLEEVEKATERLGL